MCAWWQLMDNGWHCLNLKLCLIMTYFVQQADFFIWQQIKLEHYAYNDIQVLICFYKVESAPQRRIGSIADYDPMSNNFGSSGSREWQETMPEPTRKGIVVSSICYFLEILSCCRNITKLNYFCNKIHFFSSPILH